MGRKEKAGHTDLYEVMGAHGSAWCLQECTGLRTGQDWVSTRVCACASTLEHTHIHACASKVGMPISGDQSRGQEAKAGRGLGGTHIWNVGSWSRL